jgi:hypothetical protein
MTGRGRSILFTVTLGASVLAVIIWAGWSAMRRSAGMTPRDMSETAFLHAAPEASAQAVVEILSVGTGGELRGLLLRTHGGGYQPTSVAVTAQLTPGSAIVMGAAADIKPRAVLQLSGRFDDHHRLRVARVVVLTGYVSIEQ